MIPKFKISKIANLQDARYSAALGFDFLSFSLARGDDKKLPATLIWNMVNWLEGPEIILEINADSWEELDEVTFDYAYLSLPLTDLPKAKIKSNQSLILTATEAPSVSELQKILTTYPESEIKFELTFSDTTDALAYQEIFPNLLLNFSSLDLYFEFLKQKHENMPWGISLQKEADEEPGFLDYERIDELMGIFSDVHL